MFPFLHYHLSVAVGLSKMEKKNRCGILVAQHSSSSLLFSSTHFEGEEKETFELQFVKDHRNSGPWGQCVPNSSAGRSVCVLGRRVPFAFWSREYLLYLSLWVSYSLYPSCSRVEFSKGEGRGKRGERVGQREEGWREREMAEGSFQSVSLAVASQLWNARSMLQSLFREVSLLSGALLNSLRYYQTFKSALVLWRRSIKGEREKERLTWWRRGFASLKLSWYIANKKQKTLQIHKMGGWNSGWGKFSFN